MRKVEVRALIQAPPAKVISAFTEPSMLSVWWQVERALVEKRAGGSYVLAWGISQKGFGYVSSGIIKSYKPEAELEIENFVYMNPEKQILGPMSLAIHVTPRGEKTELELCQDGYQEGGDWDWYYEAVKMAWPVVVGTLKEYLEEGIGRFENLEILK